MEYPLKFKKFLELHGDEPIRILKIGRTPINKNITLFLNMISNKKFDEAQKEANYDNFFHLFLIINDKYKLEKNQLIKASNYKKDENEENFMIPIPQNVNLSINNLLNNVKINKDNVIGNYDAFKNNCQDFLINILTPMGLIDSNIIQFIKQDTGTLIKKMPEYTKKLSNLLTDMGAQLDRGFQWITNGAFSFSRGTKKLRKFKPRLRYYKNL